MIKTSLALAAALCALALPSHAALINWGSATNISGSSDVSTAGTLLGAFNVGGPSTVVNGVTFQAFALGGISNTVGNFTLASTAVINSSPSGSALAPFTALPAGYQTLLGSSAANGRLLTLTLNGLTVGRSYLFETWVNESASATSQGFTFDVVISAGNNVTLDPNPSLAEGGLGQYVLGTFTATATSQQVTYDDSEIGGRLNAFQLRLAAAPAVPEPGTALAGLASLGLCLGARRRRK